MMFPQNPRARCDEYLRYVRQQGCVSPGCRKRPVESHHYGPSGVGLKSHDYQAVGACAFEHHPAWQQGKDKEFQAQFPQIAKQIFTRFAAVNQYSKSKKIRDFIEKGRAHFEGVK